MPFPRLNKFKSSATNDNRPLLYAQDQSPSTPSLAPSTATNTTTATLQPYSDVTQPNDTTDTSNDGKVSNETPETKTETPVPFHRPTTPPQGSNHNPWSSYRDLPPDHPVFRYPDSLREKMYAKGVDPVVKAEMDLARLGKVHGESHHGKSFWKRGTSMMGQFGTMSTGGAF